MSNSDVAREIEIEVSGLNFHYADGKHVLKDISLSVHKNAVTALIGPPG